MALDKAKNFAVSYLAVAYSIGEPTLTLPAGHGARYLDPAVDGPYNIVVWDIAFLDPGEAYHSASAQIFRVTAKTGDVLTVTAAQEGTTDVNLPLGCAVFMGPTAKMFEDIVADLHDPVTVDPSISDVISIEDQVLKSVDATADKIVFWDDSEGKLTFLTLGEGLTIVGDTINVDYAGMEKPVEIDPWLGSPPGTFEIPASSYIEFTPSITGLRTGMKGFTIANIDPNTALHLAKTDGNRFGSVIAKTSQIFPCSHAFRVQNPTGTPVVAYIGILYWTD